MKKSVFALVLALVSLISSGVHAQYCLGTCGGFYGTAMGGVLLYERLPIAVTDGGTTRYEEKFDMGFAGIGAVGYEWINGLSFEGELGYHRAGISSYRTYSSGAITDGDGTLELITMMGNVIFRCNCNDNGCFPTPFFGAGIGVAWAYARDNTLGLDFHTDDLPFAWQLFGGFEISIRDHCMISVQYRNLNVAEMSFEEGADVLFTENFAHIHEILVGIRFIFAG